jgi:hypothetical protein
MSAKTSKLLIDDGEQLTLQTKLAVLVGDRQAMALQQIHYWSGLNQKFDRADHFMDDQWWVYNTWQEWHDKNFPFWSISTLRRVFAGLEADGLIITRAHDDKNKGAWVTINYGQLENLLNQQDNAPRVKRLEARNQKRVSGHDDDGGSAQNEQTGSAQNEQGGLSKMNRPSVQNEQTLSDTENTENTAESITRARPISTEQLSAAQLRGMGMGALIEPQRRAAVTAIEAHPLWHAWVRGWDGITPDVPPFLIDKISDHLDTLERRNVLPEDIEVLTRQKLNDPKRTSDYRFTYLLNDLPTFWLQQRKARHAPAASSPFDGLEIVE